MRFTKQDRPIIETVPKIEGLKCKAMVYGLFSLVTILPYLIFFYIWWEYDWLIAIGIGLFLYLLSAVVMSKLRLLSLPKDQYERSLGSLEIAKWYIGKNHCY